MQSVFKPFGAFRNFYVLYYSCGIAQAVVTLYGDLGNVVYIAAAALYNGRLYLIGSAKCYRSFPRKTYNAETVRTV